MTTTGPELDAMARQVAGLRGAWQTLLRDHTADSRGRCRGCRESQGAGQLWPCMLHTLATRAGELATRQQLEEQELAKRTQPASG